MDAKAIHLKSVQMATYKMRGVKRLVTREKSGPTKKQIKESPSYELLRYRNMELGGRSTMGKWVRAMLYPLKHMANYNISGFINARLIPAQECDTENEWGKRSILLSRMPWLLQGFNMNEGILFDTIVRNPVTYTLNRKSGEALLEIPALLPGINFQVPDKYAVYSLVATLGVIPDFHFNGFGYSENRDYALRMIDIYRGDWYPCLTGSAATTVNLKLPESPPDNAFSLVTGIGIQFGTILPGNKIEIIKRTGAAKILAMG